MAPEATAKRIPSIAEIDGRYEMLASQRDNYANVAVLQAGQIAHLREELTVAQKELEALKAEKARYDEFHNRGTLGVSP